MTEDPLAGLIARSLRAAVGDVRSEPLPDEEGARGERVRFTRDGRPASLIIQRLRPDRALEVRLLPFLARKTDRVPQVHARGIPPDAVPAWPWVLVEDVRDAPTACDADPLDILRAKLDVERAVAGDAPALHALGVLERTPTLLVSGAGIDDPRTRAIAARLDMWPNALVHGDLRCGSARLTDRGVVLTGWSAAHLGCALLDVARLRADLAARGDAAGAAAVRSAAVLELPGSEELLDDADALDAALRESGAA